MPLSDKLVDTETSAIIENMKYETYYYNFVVYCYVIIGGKLSRQGLRSNMEG